MVCKNGTDEISSIPFFEYSTAILFWWATFGQQNCTKLSNMTNGSFIIIEIFRVIQ